jgi:hypothetical protein
MGDPAAHAVGDAAGHALRAQRQLEAFLDARAAQAGRPGVLGILGGVPRGVSAQLSKFSAAVVASEISSSPTPDSLTASFSSSSPDWYAPALYWSIALLASMAAFW